jgi:hypothetical protein
MRAIFLLQNLKGRDWHKREENIKMDLKEI